MNNSKDVKRYYVVMNDFEDGVHEEEGKEGIWVKHTDFSAEHSLRVEAEKRIDDLAHDKVNMSVCIQDKMKEIQSLESQLSAERELREKAEAVIKKRETETGWGAVATLNDELIVAKTKITELRALLKAKDEALKKYGKHSNLCGYENPYPNDICSCDLIEALALKEGNKNEC